MGQFSRYYRDKIVNHMLRNQAFTPPANLYLMALNANTGVHDNAPTSEVTGGSYGRVGFTLTAPDNGATANVADALFSKATTPWGSITTMAIVDHQTNTNWGVDVNVIGWSDLNTAREILAGDRLVIDAGDLDIQV